jgi:hypothetical protein
VEKGVKRFKRVTVKLSEEVYEEVRKLAGGRISAWISEQLERIISEEHAKLLLNALPEEIKAQLLERAKGNERKAADMALHYLSLALEEAEEEEAAQEAIAFANKMESLKEKARGEDGG